MGEGGSRSQVIGGVPCKIWVRAFGILQGLGRRLLVWSRCRVGGFAQPSRL